MNRTGRLAMAVAVVLGMAGGAAASELPPKLAAGFQMIREGKPADALALWAPGTLWERNTRWIADTTAFLERNAEMRGNLVAVELARRIRVSDNITRYYIALIYQRGPIYVYAECVRTTDDLIVAELFVHTELNQVPGALQALVSTPLP